MSTQKLTKKQKVYNLLKNGKACKASTIAKRVYGEYNDATYGCVRAIISNLCTKDDLNIDLVATGTYQLTK